MSHPNNQGHGQGYGYPPQYPSHSAPQSIPVVLPPPQQGSAPYQITVQVVQGSAPPSNPAPYVQGVPPPNLPPPPLFAHPPHGHGVGPAGLMDGPRPRTPSMPGPQRPGSSDARRRPPRGAHAPQRQPGPPPRGAHAPQRQSGPPPQQNKPQKPNKPANPSVHDPPPSYDECVWRSSAKPKGDHSDKSQNQSKSKPHGKDKNPGSGQAESGHSYDKSGKPKVTERADMKKKHESQEHPGSSSKPRREKRSEVYGSHSSLAWSDFSSLDSEKGAETQARRGSAHRGRRGKGGSQRDLQHWSDLPVGSSLGESPHSLSSMSLCSKEDSGHKKRHFERGRGRGRGWQRGRRGHSSSQNQNDNNGNKGKKDEEEDAEDDEESEEESESEEDQSDESDAGSTMSGFQHEEEDDINICQKIQVSYQIHRSFDEIKSLKSIMKGFLTRAGFFTWKLSEESILLTNSFGRFTVFVSSMGRHSGAAMIKEMKHVMTKKLKAYVSVRYKYLGPSEDKGSTEGNEKREKKSREPSEGDESLVGASNEKQPFADEPSTKGSVPEMVPTKVYISVTKHFPNAQGVFRFLTNIAKEEKIVFELLSDSIKMSAPLTKCEVICQSKAGARKIMKLLNKEKTSDKVVTRASFSPLQDVGGLPSVNVKQVQQKNSDRLHQMEVQMSSAMKVHEEKMAALEADLVVIEEKMSDSFICEETYGAQIALREKLTEARQQQEEFLCACDKLIDMLKDFIKIQDPEVLKDNEKCAMVWCKQISLECSRLKQSLPMYARRKDVVKTVQGRQVTVILGETGSGKSTQLVQYLYEAGLAGELKIICTQPRKVAAITLADRVASEMDSKPGELVGFKTGVRSNINDTKTKIVFSTDHSLLNECLQDRYLTQYSCIIIDEAHERSINTDILLGMVKACLPFRPDLKIVITSATIDPGLFIKYFKTLPELRVSGRMFPVEVHYEANDEIQEFENFQMKAVEKALHIHLKEDPGDILVFLTSPVEIMQCCEEFHRRMVGKRQDFKCVPLHGQLPEEEQKKVFEPAQPGVRKIVFSTNCAETSVTIDGIKYVVDTGLAKDMRFDPKRNMTLLDTHIISQSSADQRKGRSGRTSSGHCYRLFSLASYKAMSPNTLPEILRVHLAQGLLKLYELGMDIEKYDFVQAPSTEALQCAMALLRELGALEGSSITDLGRFLSKMPFDPRQGYLVYQGWREKLLFESVVIASLISNGCNVFYRGLSESDTQKCALSQTEFGSPYGDAFTCLEVFKAWTQVDKKDQSKWCSKKSINYKILRFTNQSVSETALILKRELHLMMPRTFSSSPDWTSQMRKIIFEANVSSVCHYLGHAKAGYFAVSAQKQVHVHPSSCLSKDQPEWAVYTELTKTSRDFVKGLTVVDEEWIHDAVNSGKLPMDLEEISNMKIEKVFKLLAGPTVLRALVGPRYCHLRALENDLSNAGMKTVVVEADRDMGSLEVLSTSPIMLPEFADKLNNLKKATVEELRLRKKELALTNKGTIDQDSGCRVVLGEGGEASCVLMPWESNTVLIKKVSKGTTAEQIAARFESFRTIQIVECWKSLNIWGFVKFECPSEAATAVSALQADEDIVAVLGNTKKYSFTARISWCRRPAKGLGIAFIKCPPLARQRLTGAYVSIKGKDCSVEENRKGDDLLIRNVGEMREEDILDELLRHLEYEANEKKDFFVSVNRQQVSLPSDREIALYKAELSRSLQQHIPEEDFEIDLFPLRNEKVVYQKGLIKFRQTRTGLDVCKSVKNSLRVSGHQAVLTPRLRAVFNVKQAVMNACSAPIDKALKTLQDSGIETNKKSTKSGDCLITLECSEEDKMIHGREILVQVLEGRFISFKDDDKYNAFFSQTGKEFLQSLKSRLEVEVVMDLRKQTVNLHGADRDVDIAVICVEDFLKKSKPEDTQQVVLTGPSQPKGLLKALMTTYGSMMEDLATQSGVADVKVDFRKHQFSLTGSSEAIKACQALIDTVRDGLLQQHTVETRSLELPECSVCLTEIENTTDMLRLEACGHTYCLECMKAQVIQLAQSNTMPLNCASCDAPIVLKDFELFVKNNWISFDKLAQIAVSSYVNRHANRCRFCPTPDCPVAYTVTENRDGGHFECPSCGAHTCTSCHAAAHLGIPCAAVAGSAQAEADLKKWQSEDTASRKACPGCGGPVEKVYGCNHMTCLACRTHFCWLCLAIAESVEKCYSHLSQAHGGVFDVPDDL